ncbi:hypothetical protein skT53_29740 [Effusibacillus dendaii]|uniref:Ammonia monooxygenase n=2 Tax=Effusibacillus dendaii TaxID=2743772 RepID=A0A7I8DG88_9BACL|nr:hypothetical protein skT53_29740 [Effusibacillus dendaii]
MMLSTTGTVIVSVAMGYWIAVRCGMNVASGVFGNVPGGLVQMVSLSQEIQNVDVTAVTLMQTMRLLTIVFLAPFLAVHWIRHDTAVTDQTYSMISSALPTITHVALYLVIAILGAWAGRRIHLPSSHISGPLLATAIASIWLGGGAPHVPPALVNLSQLFIIMFVVSPILTTWFWRGPLALCLRRKRW